MSSAFDGVVPCRKWGGSPIKKEQKEEKSFQVVVLYLDLRVREIQAVVHYASRAQVI
jgi:hypothetical protein